MEQRQREAAGHVEAALHLEPSYVCSARQLRPNFFRTGCALSVAHHKPPHRRPPVPMRGRCTACRPVARKAHLFVVIRGGGPLVLLIHWRLGRRLHLMHRPLHRLLGILLGRGPREGGQRGRQVPPAVRVQQLHEHAVAVLVLRQLSQVLLRAGVREA